jgi:hypothetical protein
VVGEIDSLASIRFGTDPTHRKPADELSDQRQSLAGHSAPGGGAFARRQCVSFGKIGQCGQKFLGGERRKNTRIDSGVAVAGRPNAAKNLSSRTRLCSKSDSKATSIFTPLWGALKKPFLRLQFPFWAMAIVQSTEVFQDVPDALKRN